MSKIVIGNAALVVSLAVLLGTTRTEAAVSQLGTLSWSFDFQTQTFANPSMQAVRFVLFYPPPLGQDPAYVGMDAPRFTMGQTGSFDMTLMNQGPPFTNLVGHLTNGSNEYLTVGAQCSNVTSNGSLFYVTGGDTIGKPEGPGLAQFLWGLGNPDLAGNEIGFIRVSVQQLNVTLSDYAHDRVSGQVAWEFWGSPIPAPSSGVVLAALLYTGPRRSRRLVTSSR